MGNGRVTRSEWEAVLHEVRRTTERSYDYAVARAKRRGGLISDEDRRLNELVEDGAAEMLELIDRKLRDLKGD